MDFEVINGRVFRVKSIEAVIYSFRDLTGKYEVMICTKKNWYVIDVVDTEGEAKHAIFKIYQNYLRE